MSHTDEKRNPGVLSTSTILILSGFLIGLTVGKIVAEDLSPYVLACGLSGFLAFIALDIAQVKRTEERAREEQEQMETRLTKHVNSLSNPGFVLPKSTEADFTEADFEEIDPSEHVEEDLTENALTEAPAVEQTAV